MDEADKAYIDSEKFLKSSINDIKHENIKRTGYCIYCGEKCKDRNMLFCSKECQEDYEKFVSIENRKKRYGY